MITISDTLKPQHVDLTLGNIDSGEAVQRVTSLLEGDERVSDAAVLYEMIKTSVTCAPNTGYEICIPHARTESVNTMVMAAGRSDQGIIFPSGPKKVHFLFVIAVPLALAADYLRIVGALARILSKPQATRQLKKARTGRDFVAVLGDTEMKL